MLQKPDLWDKWSGFYKTCLVETFLLALILQDTETTFEVEMEVKGDRDVCGVPHPSSFFFFILQPWLYDCPADTCADTRHRAVGVERSQGSSKEV